jgi:glycosyltransferase involved in cell wall biosynthesis
LRVLHCLWKFSDLSETFIYDYVVGTQEFGTEAAVLTEGRLRPDERPFAPVYAVRRPRKLMKLLAYAGRQRAPFLGRAEHRRVIQEFRPDLLHCHYGPYAWYMLPLARALRIPVVTTFYGHDISRLARQAGWRRRYAELARYGAAFTVLSEEMRERVLKLGFPEERLHVVHLTADDTRFPLILPSSKQPLDPVRILSVGRLVPKKGYEELLRAVATITESGHDLRLTIVGDGPLWDHLVHLRDTLGLHNRVTFAGALGGRAVEQAFAEHHLFALASKTAPDGDREGTPTVLIEALLAGLPICSTRHAGIPEVVPHEYHRWLAEEGDVRGLAACLENLLQHRSEWDAAANAGRRYAEAHFTKATQIALLQKVYETAIEGPPYAS